MEKLNDIIKELISYLQFSDTVNQNVSKASVGWHMEHCLLIINGSLKGLVISAPEKYQPNFTIKKWAFLTFGKVPRGKISAPKAFVPREEPTTESIEKLYELSRIRITEVENLPEKSFIKHPFLGDLDKKTTFKFLTIHTNHHLKIIKDIMRE